MAELDGTGIVCDYILGSGAEVRDPQRKIVKECGIGMESVSYTHLDVYKRQILSCDEANYFKLGKGKELSGFTNISKD